MKLQLRGSHERKGRLIMKDKEYYLLMADLDGKCNSLPESIGFIVSTKEEAERFVNESKIGYKRTYVAVILAEDLNDKNLNIVRTRLIVGNQLPHTWPGIIPIK